MLSPACSNNKHSTCCRLSREQRHRAGADRRAGAARPALQFEAIAGHGIRATVEAKTLLVGNRKLMTDNKVAIDTIEARAAALAEDGKTPMFVLGVRAVRRSGPRLLFFAPAYIVVSTK
jgi:hypothetical protein